MSGFGFDLSNDARDVIHESCQFFPCRLHSIDDHPFFEGIDVWRREQSGFPTRCAQACGDHRCGGPFALATGYVNHGDVQLRVLDPLEQVSHAVEFEVAGGVEVVVESFVVDSSEQELDRLLVRLDRRMHRRGVVHAVPRSISERRRPVRFGVGGT